MSRRLRVWSIPLRTRFRGITVREGVLLEGPRRAWGEWSPFLEYDAADRRALAALRGGGGRRRLAGAGARRRAVNVTVPAVGPERAHEIVRGRRLHAPPR